MVSGGHVHLALWPLGVMEQVASGSHGPAIMVNVRGAKEKLTLSKRCTSLLGSKECADDTTVS